MKATSHDFKLGLFVVGALALLLAALFVFGASKFFQKRNILETYVPGSVEGLKVGAPVMLRGVPVGEVTRINFTWNVYHRSEPRYVLVDFDVRTDVSLVPPGRGFAQHIEQEVKQGLRARVKSQGLVGASVLSLDYLDPDKYPPSAVPWRPQHVYVPSAPGEFSEIMAGIDRTVGQLQKLDFKQLVAAVQRDIDAAGQFLDHLDQVNVPAIGTNANALLADLRYSAEELHSFLGSSNNADFTHGNLPLLTEHSDQVLVALRQTVTRLDRVLENFNSVAFNQTVDNLRAASQQLDEVLHEVKTYPSGVLFGSPPEPARSVERVRR
jgi:ABC-type transporter Mla subunit MlaD